MRVSALHVIIIVHGNSHDLAALCPEQLALCGLGVHICPHIIHTLVVDLEVPLSNLISDKEETVLDVLTILPSAHPTVVCQQYGGISVLIKDITLNRIPL